jgi:hypothetical protein
MSDFTVLLLLLLLLLLPPVVAAAAEMLERKAKQGKYQQAADRLMDMEGLPHK